MRVILCNSNSNSNNKYMRYTHSKGIKYIADIHMKIEAVITFQHLESIKYVA